VRALKLANRRSIHAKENSMRLYLICACVLGSFTAPGPAAADAPPTRYTFPASGTVYDTLTKLTWQRAVVGTYYHATAASYCEGLSLAGTGWRWPTRGELLTIVDRTRYKPAIDPNAFPDTPAEYFWTSNESKRSPGYYWAIEFIEGSSAPQNLSGGQLYRVRCVR
jgi:Protein of unknown function (DUF1566)